MKTSLVIAAGSLALGLMLVFAPRATRGAEATGPATGPAIGPADEASFRARVRPDSPNEQVRRIEVTDSATGAPIADASVMAWSDGALLELARTDRHGGADCRPPGGAHARRGILLVAAGYAPRLRWLEPGDDSVQRVTLEEGRALEVRVRASDGSPGASAFVRLCVSGVELQEPSGPAFAHYDRRATSIDTPTNRRYFVEDGVGLRAWTAVADHNGVASFSDLPHNARAFINVEYGPPQRTVKSFRLAPELESFEWTAPHCVPLRGVFTDSAGAPLASTAIWAEPADDGVDALHFGGLQRPLLRALTDADGRFAFASVPIGEYLVGPAPRESSESEAPLPIGRRYTVDAGDIELQLRAESGAAIHGVVIDADGAPARGAKVTLTNSSPVFSHSCTTAHDGSFAAEGLPQGTFELRTSLAGCPCAADPLKAQTGDVGVLLQLQRTSPLRLRALDPGDVPLQIAEVLISPASGGLLVAKPPASNRGAFALAEAPPGLLHVAVRAQDGSMGVVHDVRASDVLTQALTVRMSQSAQLRVENRSDTLAVEALVQTALGATVAVVRIDPGDSIVVAAPVGDLRVCSDRLGMLECVPVRCEHGQVNSAVLFGAESQTLEASHAR